MNLSYGDWDGIYVRSNTATVNIRGILNISSYASGGKYQNDITFGAKGSPVNIAAG